VNSGIRLLPLIAKAAISPVADFSYPVDVLGLGLQKSPAAPSRQSQNLALLCSSSWVLKRKRHQQGSSRVSLALSWRALKKEKTVTVS
jgi:hypothetical protein